MRAYSAFVPIAVLFQTVNAAISPDYHSLMWKFGDANFWSPLGLDTATYALESPAGAAPDSLSKRGHAGLGGTQYLPCTVITLDGDLSGAALETRLQQYLALDDDVWSEKQVSTISTLQEHLPDTL